jgi:hypothetical protein
MIGEAALPLCVRPVSDFDDGRAVQLNKRHRVDRREVVENLGVVGACAVGKPSTLSLSLHVS